MNIQFKHLGRNGHADIYSVRWVKNEPEWFVGVNEDGDEVLDFNLRFYGSDSMVFYNVHAFAIYPDDLFYYKLEKIAEFMVDFARYHGRNTVSFVKQEKDDYSNEVLADLLREKGDWVESRNFSVVSYTKELQ